jgi:Ca2+-binding RTX toxin-like protein
MPVTKALSVPGKPAFGRPPPSLEVYGQFPPGTPVDQLSQDTDELYPGYAGNAGVGVLYAVDGTAGAATVTMGAATIDGTTGAVVMEGTAGESTVDDATGAATVKGTVGAATLDGIAGESTVDGAAVNDAAGAMTVVEGVTRSHADVPELLP